MIKHSVKSEKIILLCVPRTEAINYMKQILINLMGEINSNTIRVRKSNTPVSEMHRSFRQKINQEIAESN